MTKEHKIEALQQSIELFFMNLKQETHKVKIDEPLATGQIFLLFMLYHKGTSKATDISNRIGITSGAVTGMTDKLVNLQLINRDRSEEDRRVVLLSLTDRGRKIVEDIHSHRLERMRILMSELPVEEITQMVQMFNKINDIYANNKE